MTTFTRTWDATYEAIPEDDDDALEGAMRIRHVKEDLRERMEVDHSWGGNEHDGKHNKITLRTVTAPTLDTGDTAVYAKSVGGKPELFFKDADGNEVQITTTGNLNAALPTGVVLGTYSTTAPAGWVLMNDGSIGNATSGATTRANADTEALFTLLWNNVSDTWAPVSGGRGASAAADFAASKTITLPKVLGRALAAAGAGAGLTARSLGQTFGEENHLLTAAESGMPNHGHSGSVTYQGTDGGGLPGSPRGFPPLGTRTDTGGVTNTDYSNFILSVSGSGTLNASSAHNNMQPTSFLNYIIKL